MKVVALAGGTGGAKLAAGLQELLGTDLTVIANTGDDIEALGVYVSPDPDLCTYWLSDQIDEEQGWGIKDDTFTVFERLKQLGAPDWFGLSDRDLATCLERRRRLDAGERLTVIGSDLARALGGSRHGPADVRRAGPHPGPDPVRLARIPGIPRPGPGRPTDRGDRARRHRGRVDHARDPGGDRGRRRDRHRAVESGHLDRADPRGAGDQRADQLRRGAGRSRSAPSSPARSSRVRPTSSCGPPAGNPPPPASPPPTRRSIDAFVVDAADPGPDPEVEGVAVTRFDTLMGDAEGRRRVAAATLELAASVGG